MVVFETVLVLINQLYFGFIDKLSAYYYIQIKRYVIIVLYIFASQNRRGHNRNGYVQNCFGSKRAYSIHAGSSSTGDEKQAIVVANFQENKAPESNNVSKCECTKEQVEKQTKFQCVGMYWVLVSLAVTVFWGKIDAIILIPILLCFFPLWNAICCWIKGIPKSWDAESEVYQKNHRDRNGMSDRNKQRLKRTLNLLAKILVYVLEGFLL